MKKLLLLFAAILMASTGLWAETITVSYRYPVYNTVGVPTSGIKEWKTATAEATELVVNTSSQQVLTEGWYAIVNIEAKFTKGIVCQGNVHLILGDETIVTVTGGILVSGNGSSLTIYGEDAQTGQLIATGGEYGAGIGGGLDASVSNITINGGIVTANGGYSGAGIGVGAGGSASDITINGGTVTANGGSKAAGIGGGARGSASDITINGGKVTACSGLDNSTGIGSGAPAPDQEQDPEPSSNIFVATTLQLKADGNNPPTTVIENTGGDLASSLAGKRYVAIEDASKGNLTADDFEIELPGDNIYNGLVQEAVVSFKSGITGAGEMTVTYKQGGEEVAPVNVGDYGIYVSVTEGTDYNAFPETKIGKRSIWKASYTFSDFNVFLPENLEYDGTPKVATFVYDDKDGQRTGYGDITVKYNDNTQAPIEPGDYVVSIDISEGENYIPLEHMTCDEWSFTITIDLDEYKAEVIKEIATAREGIQNENINNWINAAIHDISQPGTDTKAKVDNIKLKILDLIYAFQDGKAEGDAAGYERAKAELLGSMAEPCTDCPAVEVTKGTKTVTLYNPEKVEFKKTQQEQ